MASGGSVVGRTSSSSSGGRHRTVLVAEWCSTISGPKLLVKTVHLPCARVTHDSRDDTI